MLPIPPGLRWDDEMPVILPRSTGILPVSERKEHGQDARGTKLPGPKVKTKNTTAMPARRALGGWSFAPPPAPASAPSEPAEPKKRVKLTVKNDPKLIAAARELRDRWLERVNSGLDVPQAIGKYSLARLLEADHSSEGLPARLIEAQAA